MNFNHNYPDRVLKNPIVTFLWGGWNTTSLDLQQAGWQISVNQNVERGFIEFIIKHPAWRIYGVSERVYDFDYHKMNFNNLSRFDIPIKINHMCSELHIHHMCENIMTFQPIDAEPQICRNEIKSIEDFKIFQPPLVRTNEIIVEPDQVNKIMKQILKVQSPKQKEIREKLRKQKERNEIRQQENFHAQIISLVR